MQLELIVCETCHRGMRDGGQTDGDRMAKAMQGILEAGADLDGMALTTMKCLMACGQACTVHLRARGKMGYVLGDLGPEEDMTTALTEYLRAYARSPEGVVPYREWPEVLKGRFIARVPPAES
jgi:predicted metal-binding protein